MEEHVQELSNSPTWTHETRRQLVKLCQRRARSEPLQYILGSQPFGELEIKCKPGVLIPR
jgi:methylase of polypeptide subunit release factors